MRPKSLMLLILALGCGLVASIGISQVMDRHSKQQVAVETTPIYVALHNINLGDPIDASMVSLQEWPKDKIPPGAISQLEDLEGRRPRATIIQGEPLLDAKLLAPGKLADPITSIPKGFRLKTISVDAEKSAAGLLSPGDRVDVQLFVKRDERNNIESAKTKVILQNIRVFAVDQTVQRSPDGGEERTIAKTVSLLLTPEQASKLTLAENLGQVSLIPRNPDDEESGEMAEYSTDDLLSDGGKNSREKEQAKDEEGKARRQGQLAQRDSAIHSAAEAALHHGNRRGERCPRSIVRSGDGQADSRSELSTWRPTTPCTAVPACCPSNRSARLRPAAQIRTTKARSWTK